MATPDDRAFLDRPAARLLALLVFVLCGAALAYLHRDDLGRTVPAGVAGEGAESADDPAMPCLNQRFAEIDAMVTDGIIDDDKAVLFRQRAEAMCRATRGDSPAGGPPLPSLSAE